MGVGDALDAPCAMRATLRTSMSGSSSRRRTMATHSPISSSRGMVSVSSRRCSSAYHLAGIVDDGDGEEIQRQHHGHDGRGLGVEAEADLRPAAFRATPASLGLAFGQDAFADQIGGNRRYGRVAEAGGARRSRCATAGRPGARPKSPWRGCAGADRRGGFRPTCFRTSSRSPRSSGLEAPPSTRYQILAEAGQSCH